MLKSFKSKSTIQAYPLNQIDNTKPIYSPTQQYPWIQTYSSQARTAKEYKRVKTLVSFPFFAIASADTTIPDHLQLPAAKPW